MDENTERDFKLSHTVYLYYSPYTEKVRPVVLLPSLDPGPQSSSQGSMIKDGSL
ncbi:hypothetical protein BgiMline_017330, partial [Biomphalaria glabrata]